MLSQHTEEMLFTKGIKLSPRKWWQLLSSFPELVTWTHWCPDKWDTETLSGGTSLTFPLGYLPGILHFAHFLSVTKPVPPKSLSSSFMSSSHLLSPETWSHQEFFHFFHPSHPLHPFFPNLSLGSLGSTTIYPKSSPCITVMDYIIQNLQRVFQRQGNLRRWPCYMTSSYFQGLNDNRNH